MDCQMPSMDELESRTWRGLIRVIELLPPALDAQMQRDSNLTHFEFMVLAILRMTTLAQGTNASLARLSHVCSRLEGRGLVIDHLTPEQLASLAEITEAFGLRLDSENRTLLAVKSGTPTE